MVSKRKNRNLNKKSDDLLGKRLQNLIHGSHPAIDNSMIELKELRATSIEYKNLLKAKKSVSNKKVSKDKLKFYSYLGNVKISSLNELQQELQAKKNIVRGKYFTGRMTKKKLTDFTGNLKNSVYSTTVLGLGTFQWQYLLKEMEWMSKDFRNETKSRFTMSRKVGTLAKRQYENLKNAKKREKKKRATKLKLNNAKLSREVKTYWENIDKLAIHELKEKRKVKQEQGMEKHLDKILRRTEKYSEALAARFDQQDEYSSSESDYEIDEDLEPSAEEAAAELAALHRDNIQADEQEQTSEKEEETDVKPSTDTIEVESKSIISDHDIEEYKYKQPFLLAPGVELRNYQRTGLDWLIGLHRNNLNGILADEMGLGKTIQTIALFAFLAGFEGFWGPHLIIVPSSVVLNWELEFKRFFPGFKVMSYYGSLKERKEKRIGWNRTGAKADLSNSFNVLVTSYKLAVQDATMLKRRKWGYMVLDEAHNIKNFKSQRWQVLLNFNAKRRLLLTGTPLQNSLIELWSLLHFLMPNIFTSQSEFKHWFANPLTKYIENHSSTVTYTKTDVLKQANNNDKISNEQSSVSIVDKSDKDLLANLSDNAPSFVKKLHNIINPFILRRKKEDVLKELPKKIEHVIKIKLSLRQQKLYEDFISRKKTHQTLLSGGYLGMMQILMKLRMVCNHPDIFEPRVVTSGLLLDPLTVVSEIRRCRKCVNATQLGNSSSTYLDFVNLDSFNFAPFNLSGSYSNKPFHIIEVQESSENLTSFFKIRPGITLGLLNEPIEERKDSIEIKDSIRYQDISKKATFLYSKSLLHTLTVVDHTQLLPGPVLKRSYESINKLDHIDLFIKSAEDRLNSNLLVYSKILCVTKKVHVVGLEYKTPCFIENMFKPLNSLYLYLEKKYHSSLSIKYFKENRYYHQVQVAQKMTFPDSNLTEFDSGKLIFLKRLLSRLASKNKRNNKANNKVLIFTQMTKMLDILEGFLAQNNFTYVRLDGSTDIRRRQILMQKFNTDYNLFAFILSTRSGGLGINLTGANNVIFYDSDWNPQVDLQAQDRAHRIGQTRNVNIYRLVCERTIEENIFIKQRQKRQLSLVSVDFKRMKNDLLQNFSHPQSNDDQDLDEGQNEDKEAEKDILKAMELVEDDKDRDALKKFQVEQKEEEDDLSDVEKQDPKKSKQTSEITGLLDTLNEIDRDNLALRLKTVNYDALVKDSYGGEDYEAFLEEQDQDSDSTEFDLDDQVSDTDLLVCKDNNNEDSDIEQQYDKYRLQVMQGRKFRMLTGKCWIEKYEKIIHDSIQKNGTKTTLRKYYYNIDTNEATYLRPRILDSYPIIRRAFEKGWCALPENVLLRLYLFLRGDKAFISMKLVNLNFYLASKSPKLVVWVSYNVNPGDQNRFRALTIDDGLYTVGDRIECLYQRGEVFYAGVIAGVKLVQDAVTKEIRPVYRVAYLDGSEEDFVEERYIRKDVGGRFTFIYHDNKVEKINRLRSRFHMTISNYNKNHSSNFSCGVQVPYTVFKDIYSAIKNAHNGDTLVLKTGVHHLISRYNDYLHIFDKVRKKHVRIITEKTLIQDLQLENKVDKIVWFDQLDGISSKMKSSRGAYLKDGKINSSRLCKNSYSKNPIFIKKRHLHPLSDVVLGGVELPFRSNVADIANKKENNNSYGINLVKQELEYGSLLVLHETSLFFTELLGSLFFHKILIYYNRINKDVLRSNNLQNNKLQNMFILKGHCTLVFSECMVNCRFMINNAFRVMHSSSTLCLYKTVIRSSKKTSVLLESGKFGSWHCQYANNAVSAVTLRFGFCLFQGNLVSLKNNIGVKIENFQTDKNANSLYTHLIINTALNSIITQILAEKYKQKLKAIISGNLFERKVDKDGKVVGIGAALEVTEIHETRSIRSAVEQDTFFSKEEEDLCLKKYWARIQEVSCFNNIFTSTEAFSQKPYSLSPKDCSIALTNLRDKEEALWEVFTNTLEYDLGFDRAEEFQKKIKETYVSIEDENHVISESLHNGISTSSLKARGKHEAAMRNTKINIKLNKHRKRPRKPRVKTEYTPSKRRRTHPRRAKQENR